MPKNEVQMVVVPGWVKLALGTTGVGLFLWKAPLMEAFAMFAYVVLIPVGFILSIGAVLTGGVETFADSWNSGADKLWKKIKEAGQKLEEAEERETTDEVRRPPPVRRGASAPAPSTRPAPPPPPPRSRNRDVEDPHAHEVVES